MQKPMYYVRKRFEISASHQLALPYASKCNYSHGHNWIITVYCRNEELDNWGMVADFSYIKEVITARLDHKHLNDQLTFNPTAENIAEWIFHQFITCYRVDVEESAGNLASFSMEDIAE